MAVLIRPVSVTISFLEHVTGDNLEGLGIGECPYWKQAGKDKNGNNCFFSLVFTFFSFEFKTIHTAYWS